MISMKTYKLSELYELSSGISTKPEQAGHGYPFCSFSTIFNNPILPEELPELMDTSEKEREVYSIKKGDVLLTRTSETLDELAMSSVALKDYPNATFSGFAKRLRPISKDVYPKFMAFFFRSDYFRKIINNKAIMTLRASFNENIFNDISFQLPPIEEQIKAGNFLYEIEMKIRNNNKLAENYKKMVDLIFDKWFNRYEPNSKLECVYNEEADKELPINWSFKPIRSIIDHEIGGDWGKDNPEGNYQSEVFCIRGTDINGVRDGSFEKLPKRYILNKNIDRLLSKGDYIIEVSGTPGRSTYINQNMLKRYNERLIGSNFCCAIAFKDKNMLYWFDSLWKKLHANGITTSFSGKTTIANLLFDSLAESVCIEVPPSSVLAKYNELVEPMFEEIQSLYNENNRLENTRKFLINLFMTQQVKMK